MNDHFERIFAHIEKESAPAALFARVHSEIGRMKKMRVLQGRIFRYAALTFAALAAAIPSVMELQSEAVQSGFGQFISLLFSDFEVVTAYWKEFGLSLLESMPAFGIAATFGSLLLLAIFARFLARDYEAMRVLRRITAHTK